MRYVIKGGVWKNTEDEILKVAVMKYGKNQWARISSLLTRKTPKQCKARWYEWLDPSIKKTEWSKEEDEGLLHLAKTMPTQWRTIAPLVGRTPAQCLERYQRLLDDAEREMAAGSSSLADGSIAPEAMPPVEDSRRLRPGEIDPDPEAKPARPDPVDMDEDEKEMLSEARARLANTQGKKAKRKARERQLEESRRLATLQKRRELKASGISFSAKIRRSDEMDYNADVPFQRKPLPGFYDTAEELSKPNGQDISGFLLSQLDGKRRAEVEADERKKDAKKRRTREQDDELAFVAAGTKKALIFDTEVKSKRTLLNIPAPLVGEQEIEALAKMGATEVPIETESDMVSEYTVTPRLPTRTPRMAIVDSVRQQARAAVQANSLGTPLLGEEQEESELAPATTMLLISRTPQGSVSGTPRSTTSDSHAAYGATPFRDRMGINTPSHANAFSEETPRDQRQRAQMARSHLRQALMSLPKPKNDYEIVLPGEDDAADGLEEKRGLHRRDRWDIEKEEQEVVRLANVEAQMLESQAIQRNLPRPVYLPTLNSLLQSSPYPAGSDLAKAEKLVALEMLRLYTYDAVNHPVSGAPPIDPADMESVSLDQLKAAWALLNEEDTPEVPLEPYDGHYSCILDPASKIAYDVDELATHEDQASLKQPNLTRVYENAEKAVIQAAQRAAKLENKISITQGGYLKRSQTFGQRICDRTKELQKELIELDTLRLLREREERATPIRIQEVQALVDAAKREEQSLQTRYAELTCKMADM